MEFLIKLYRYGRKTMFITSIMLMAVTGIGQVLSSSYEVFAVFVFLNAVGTAGIYPLAFIMGEYDNFPQNKIVPSTQLISVEYPSI